MTSASPIHGVMAEFQEPEHFLKAIRTTRLAGYRRMDAYSPSPIEGLTDAMDLKDSPVSLIVLTGGLTGAIGGFFIQYYAMGIDYPINVAGRPLLSWVSFIPITFECAVLVAGIFAILFGVLALNGVPQPYHPVFNVPEFARASRDRYFVCIEAGDSIFDRVETRRFLESLEPLGVYDVME